VTTINAQSSPRKAARHFDEHLSHGYYSEKEQAVGRWFGRTFDTFGIKPEYYAEGLLLTLEHIWTHG
jgi:hypothetical protein